MDFYEPKLFLSKNFFSIAQFNEVPRMAIFSLCFMIMMIATTATFILIIIMMIATTEPFNFGEEQTFVTRNYSLKKLFDYYF